MEYLYLISIGLVIIIVLGLNRCKKTKKILHRVFISNKKFYDLKKENFKSDFTYSFLRLYQQVIYYFWQFCVLYFFAIYFIDFQITYLIISLVGLIVIPLMQYVHVTIQIVLQYKADSNIEVTSGLSLKKKRMLFLIGLFVLLMIGFIILFYIFIGTSQHIEDTNGDLNELVEIQIDDTITSDMVKYTSYMSSYSYTGLQSGAASRYSDVDYNSIKISAEKISGIKVVNTTSLVANEKVRLEISVVHTEGNFKMYMVDDEGTILTELVVGSGISVYEYVATTDIEIRIIIVGESANISLEISREVE